MEIEVGKVYQNSEKDGVYARVELLNKDYVVISRLDVHDPFDRWKSGITMKRKKFERVYILGHKTLIERLPTTEAGWMEWWLVIPYETARHAAEALRKIQEEGQDAAE